jgi:hypothetical protein
LEIKFKLGAVGDFRFESASFADTGSGRVPPKKPMPVFELILHRPASVSKEFGGSQGWWLEAQQQPGGPYAQGAT